MLGKDGERAKLVSVAVSEVPVLRVLEPFVEDGGESGADDRTDPEDPVGVFESTIDDSGAERSSG